MHFRKQLAGLFLFALIAIVVTTSTGAAWLATRVATEDFNQQCLSLTSLLAQQSKLAVLYGSKETAEEITRAMFSFPDVKRIAIYDDSRLIYQAGAAALSAAFSRKELLLAEPRLDYRSANYWGFRAPVSIERDDADFEMSLTGGSQQSQTIGYVDILFGTEELIKLKNNIILGNVLISVIVTIIIAFALSRFSYRFTDPLQALSNTMESVADGGTKTRANPVGAYELKKISNAFNGMMDTLDQQNNTLLENNRDLKAHIEMYEEAEQARKQLEKQLLQAHKMEAIGQLTGGIAHDFNNILGSVLGFTSLALRINQRAYDQDKMDEYLREVVHASERAKSLIEQLLAFSRKSNSRRAEPIAAQVSINGAIKLLRSTMPSGVSFEICCEEKVPSIFMDVVQLEQVIMNLCINARDAMNGQGDIEVKLEYLPLIDTVCASCHELVQGDYVQLAVRDNGSGIPEENIEHLFEPFYTTKDVGKGSGLGLSMAHGIVHEHGGHILVETVVGVGTCFRLLFPPIQVENDKAPPKVKRMISVPKHSINANILLVDDDVSLAKFVALLLESEGYSVFIKHNAADALTEYREGKTRFDLVVTDQVMPKMSGIEMSKQLLAIAPDLPIILYSGFDRNTSKEQCFALGIKGFLRKPFDNSDLLNMVQNCLEVRV